MSDAVLSIWDRSHSTRSLVVPRPVATTKSGWRACTFVMAAS